MSLSSHVQYVLEILMIYTFKTDPESNLCCYHSGLSHYPSWIVMASQLVYFCPCPLQAHSTTATRGHQMKIRRYLFRSELVKSSSIRCLWKPKSLQALYHLPGLTYDPLSLGHYQNSTSLLPSPKLAGRFLQGNFYNLSLLSAQPFAQLSSSAPSGVYSEYDLLNRTVSGHTLKPGTHSPKHAISLSSSSHHLGLISYISLILPYFLTIHRRHSIILAV